VGAKVGKLVSVGKAVGLAVGMVVGLVVGGIRVDIIALDVSTQADKISIQNTTKANKNIFTLGLWVFIGYSPNS
jgi:hypothetical protein